MPEPTSDRTRVHRHPERGDHDLASVHRILDEALTCTVAWVDPEGRPRALPTIQARIDDTLYLHGSRAARAWKAVAAGAEVCVVATVIDALVLARTSPHHSMNYRSVVVRGEAELVTDSVERDRAFEAIVNHVVPGRSTHSRPPDAKERAATAILRVPLVEVSLKHREGGVSDDEEDLVLPYWAGVVPVSTVLGTAVPAPEVPFDTPVPEHISASGWDRTR